MELWLKLMTSSIKFTASHYLLGFQQWFGPKFDPNNARFMDVADPNGIVTYVLFAAFQNDLQKRWDGDQKPTFLKSLENLLASNNGGDGYYVGDSVSN